MSRHTKTDGILSVDKTNMARSGMIQPDFFNPLLQNGKDPSGLHRGVLTCAPNVKFESFEENEEISNFDYFLPSKT